MRCYDETRQLHSPADWQQSWKSTLVIVGEKVISIGFETQTHQRMHDCCMYTYLNSTAGRKDGPRECGAVRSRGTMRCGVEVQQVCNDPKTTTVLRPRSRDSRYSCGRRVAGSYRRECYVAETGSLSVVLEMAGRDRVSIHILWTT